MKRKNVILAFFLAITVFTSCKKEQSNNPVPKPAVSNLELGINNTKRGIIGEDFHLNADIVAGDKVDLVKIVIAQRTTETYTSAWKLELVWENYKGTKNTNVHKHFDIPLQASAGKYDFFFIVTDENGSLLEVKEELHLIKVNP